MSKKNALIIITAVFFVYLFGIVIFLFLKKSAQNSQQAASPLAPEKFVFVSPTVAVTATPSIAVLPPVDVARNFYSWYIFYQGNPLTTGAYKTSDYLADSYKKTISSLLSVSNDPKYDPVFCPQNKLTDFAVSREFYDNSGKKATVYILKYNGEG